MEELPKLLVFNSKRIMDKKSRKNTHLALKGKEAIALYVSIFEYTII